MRFYNAEYRFYCGVDLHARMLALCILDAKGQIVFQGRLAARPEDFLSAVAPYRDGLAVAYECMFAWYWLADLCAAQGIPFVLGHALYMKAIHGGKAKNDKIDAAKIPRLLRGGALPQAYVCGCTPQNVPDAVVCEVHPLPRDTHYGGEKSLPIGVRLVS
jgi:transposase